MTFKVYKYTFPDGKIHIGVQRIFVGKGRG